MAFFDNMKSKLTATSQTAVQKAKELTELTRLNGQVSEAENKINDLYHELGFEIYQAYREDPLVEVAELIDQITELHEKITDYKAQIKAINHANTCPNCGAKVNKGMAFCSSCGFKLPETEEKPVQEEKQAVVCANCGAEVEEDDIFCTVCGAKLDETELV